MCNISVCQNILPSITILNCSWKKVTLGLFYSLTIGGETMLHAHIPSVLAGGSLQIDTMYGLPCRRLKNIPDTLTIFHVHWWFWNKSQVVQVLRPNVYLTEPCSVVNSSLASWQARTGDLEFALWHLRGLRHNLLPIIYLASVALLLNNSWHQRHLKVFWEHAEHHLPFFVELEGLLNSPHSAQSLAASGRMRETATHTSQPY